MKESAMWHPRAIRKPIDRYRPGHHAAMTVHRRVIEHTAVYNGDSLYPMMSVPGTATSHFYVRWDGTIEQYVSTSVQSSANLEGNPDCITVETEDNYPHGWHNGNAPKWTDAQLDALADIAHWAHKVHGVPLRRLRNSRHGTRGIGTHRQGCDGNFPSRGILRGRVSGGERWSYSFGKTCPTDSRIRQWDEVIRRARKRNKPRPFVNRARVNRAINHPNRKRGKIVTKQLARLQRALEQHGHPAKGYPPWINSIERAVRNFQREQGWTGKDANGRLGPATCRLLGLRSVKGRHLLRPFKK